MFDWNDLRYLLAVADAGSTLKAAQALGANQTTVARRIAALEGALGQKLFERQRSGYRLTEAGAAFAEKARAMEAAARAVETEAQRRQRDLTGTVRLTCNELAGDVTLPPMLARLRRDYPNIRIEVEHSQELRDLARGEADIAIRVSKSLKGDALIARKLIPEHWGPVCSRAYAESEGMPTSPADLPAHRFIGGGGAYIWSMTKAWMQRHAPEVEVDTHYDNSTGMLAALRAGLGVGMMNQFIAAGEPDLVQCWRPSEYGWLWIVTHERTKASPHVRTVMRAIGDMYVETARERGVL